MIASCHEAGNAIKCGYENVSGFLSITFLKTSFPRADWIAASFLRQSLALAGGCACCLNAGNLFALPTSSGSTTLISPGCRRSKVKVAKIYLGTPKAHWPTPKMDIEAERNRYEAEFARMGKEFADVDFVTNQLVTKKEDLAGLREPAPGGGWGAGHPSLHARGRRAEGDPGGEEADDASLRRPTRAMNGPASARCATSPAARTWNAC